MRKTIKITVAVVLAAVVAVTAAACTGSNDEDRQMAKINETVITKQDLDTYTVLTMYRNGYDPAGLDREMEQTCLEEMVEAEVIRQYYEKNGIEIYDDAYNSGKDAFLSDIQSNDVEFLEQNEITYEELVYFYRTGYVNQKFFEETAGQYTEEDMETAARQYYDTHMDEYRVEKEKRLSMILTKKKKQADGVIDRLNQGEDFAALAQEISIDENSAANGGDLGFFKKQDVVDRFGKGIFGMKTGSYTETPVKTGDGYAVVKITDSHNSGYRSYEEVAQDITYSLYQNYNMERIEELKKDMNVEVDKL